MLRLFSRHGVASSDHVAGGEGNHFKMKRKRRGHLIDAQRRSGWRGTVLRGCEALPFEDTRQGVRFETPPPHLDTYNPAV